MRTLAILWVLLITLPVMAETIYKRVDADGRVYYGEDPKEGKAVTLPGLSTYSSPPLPRVQKEIQTAPAATETGNTVNAIYSSVVIRSPQSKENIFSNEGLVDVVVDTSPVLEEGHSIKMYLDGKVFGSVQTATAFQLTGIERGTHELKAVVYDENDSVLIRTKAITFFLRKHSIH